jgi:hypothetical protein
MGNILTVHGFLNYLYGQRSQDATSDPTGLKYTLPFIYFYASIHVKAMLRSKAQ